MNMELGEGRRLAEMINEKSNGGRDYHSQIVLLPPYYLLESISNILKGSLIGYGAQNCHYEDKGAYTGEISVWMLKSIGCNYVLVGHSERRQYFNEDNNLLKKKLYKILEADLVPIYCCGETLEERRKGEYFDVVRTQIEEVLFELNEEQYSQIIIAYEPVWAIGTGITAKPEEAEEMHSYIRGLIEKKYNKWVAEDIIILYGGSCKSSNSKELFSMPNIDGGLIGGASLDSEEFIKIVKSAE